MSMTEDARHRIYQKFEQILGAGDAAALVSQFRTVGSPELATKQDVETLGLALRSDMADLRGELRSEMAELRGELRSEMAELRGDFAELRGEFGELRGDFGELRGEVASQRSDWQAGLASLEANLSERMRQQLVAIIGLNISMFVAAITASFALVQMS